ncbi:hypothetical protein TWF696_004626 [Orbilia brochopaga]|uniref:Clr5 domain-containing protein n=1 Tax=Orbilia brochopaga TaxID=3140254 RepID=A0AAV9VA03_9PEZI
MSLPASQSEQPLYKFVESTTSNTPREYRTDSDWEPYKEYILERHSKGTKKPQIRRELKQLYGLSVTQNPYSGSTLSPGSATSNSLTAELPQIITSRAMTPFTDQDDIANSAELEAHPAVKEGFKNLCKQAIAAVKKLKLSQDYADKSDNPSSEYDPYLLILEVLLAVDLELWRDERTSFLISMTLAS